MGTACDRSRDAAHDHELSPCEYREIWDLQFEKIDMRHERIFCLRGRRAVA